MVVAKQRSKVMIVDDSEVVLAVTQDALKNAGYEVVTHPRPTGCVALILQEAPDLLLIDVNMPGLNGDTVVKMFGATQPNSQTIVLLHSSLPADVLEKKAAASGAHGYIRKSESPQDLIRQVSRWVRPNSLSGTHTLPNASSRSDPPSRLPESTARASSHSESGTILLVDHEMAQLSEYRRLVSSQPGPVEFALSGTEVLRRLRGGQVPDVVVIGNLQGSPSTEGLVREATKLGSEWKDRLIAVRDRGDAANLRQYDVTILTRPLTAAALCEAIQSCLRRAQQRASKVSRA